MPPSLPYGRRCGWNWHQRRDGLGPLAHELGQVVPPLGVHVDDRHYGSMFEEAWAPRPGRRPVVPPLRPPPAPPEGGRRGDGRRRQAGPAASTKAFTLRASRRGSKERAAADQQGHGRAVIAIVESIVERNTVHGG